MIIILSCLEFCGQFLGAFGYAEDVLVLATSRQALQIMLTICQSMLFSLEKTFVETISAQINGGMVTGSSVKTWGVRNPIYMSKNLALAYIA